MNGSESQRKDHINTMKTRFRKDLIHAMHDLYEALNPDPKSMGGTASCCYEEHIAQLTST